MWLFLVFITLVFGVLAGLYAWTVYQKLDEFQIGHPRVKELSEIIHGGAMAFLKKEYTWLAPFVGVVAILLVSALGLGAAFAFILGALCSATAGWIGMYVATNSNGRTTFAALEGMEASAKSGVEDKMLIECTEIKNSLRISTHNRPQWDIELLESLGLQVTFDEDISQLVHKDKNLDYDSVPLFGIYAVKKI